MREHGARRSARDTAWGFGFAALTVVIFSGWFVVTRFSVTHTLRVWDVTALRFGVGALLLGPALLRRRLPRGAWRNGALFAVLWGAPFVLLVVVGLQLTSATEASAVTPTLMPVLSGLIGWAVLRAYPGRVRLLGYAAIVAGLVALVTVTGFAHGAPNPAGLAALVAASASWAVYTVLFPRTGLSAIQSAALICVWSALGYVPIYLALGLSRLGEASVQELAFQAVYQGALVSAVAIVTFNKAVTLLGPGAATAIIALLPAMATAIAVPVLGEVPGPLEAAAIAIIGGGVLLAARPRNAREVSEGVER